MVVSNCRYNIIFRLRSRSAEESKREREHMERRMKTMLSLKNDISANRVHETKFYNKLTSVYLFLSVIFGTNFCSFCLNKFCLQIEGKSEGFASQG